MIAMEENINTIQIIAICGSILFIVFIVELIRKKKIREEYSLLWLFFGVIFLIISIWTESLWYIADLLGISYAPAAIFLLLIIAIISILIHYSLVISRLTENHKNLTQTIGLLEMELKKLRKEIRKSSQKNNK